MGLCIRRYLLKKEALWRGLEDKLISGYESKNGEGSVICAPLVEQ